MKKTITAVAVLALSATLALAGPGREGRGFHGKRGGEFSQRIAEKLNLTEAQKAQMKSLNESFKAQTQPLFDQMQQQKKAQHERMLAILTPEQRAQLDATKGEGRGHGRFEALNLTDAQKSQMKSLRESFRNESEPLHQQLEQARKAQHDKFLSILTPEQKAQLAEMRQNRR